MGTKTNDPDTAAGASKFGERFTVIVLLTMLVVLAYLRFQVLPSQDEPEPLAWDFENPMLDARPGDKVLFFSADRPTNQDCSVVRPEGVVLRPAKGPEEIAYHEGLRRSLPYLACGIHPGQRGADICGGRETDTVLYALNYFGMPMDTPVRVDSIRPRWMKWGERELVVYHVILERYGTLSGQWDTFLTAQAPVSGLVKWTSLLPHRTEVLYRPVPGGVK